MRHSPSSSSLKSPNGDLTNIPLTPPTAPSFMNVPQPLKAPDSPLDMRQYPTLKLPIVQAALMERTPFAIDDAKDDDEESDEDLGDTGDAVLDEVRSVTVETRLVLMGLPLDRLMRSWKRTILVSRMQTRKS
jgi:hypothetical protein